MTADEFNRLFQAAQDGAQNAPLQIRKQIARDMREEWNRIQLERGK